MSNRTVLQFGLELHVSRTTQMLIRRKDEGITSRPGASRLVKMSILFGYSAS